VVVSSVQTTSVRLSSWRRCERLRGDEDQAGDDGDESLTGLAAA
jgi:hypothetical protein